MSGHHATTASSSPIFRNLRSLYTKAICHTSTAYACNTQHSSATATSRPKAPGSGGVQNDATKFARLHCFRPNTYFDSPVIAFEINVNDRLQHDMPEIDPAQLRRGIQDKKREERRNAPAQSKSSKPSGDIIVVDLHASELLDTTAGLSPADILNLQIDRFTEVMQQNIRYIGQKIVFIHGKGEGVLRQALLKELKLKYKQCDVQDASFREYGFGATQVTIR